MAWYAKVPNSNGKLVLHFKPSIDDSMRSPFGDLQVPCGKCDGCKADRRWDWNLRLQIELKSAPSATFITLTYRPETLPDGNVAVRSHIQNFLKRLRNSPRDYGVKFDSLLRYYIASEHGDKSGRVHYHGLIFGLDMFRPPWKTYAHHFDNNGYPVFVSELLEKIWSFGFCSVGPVNKDSIGYISNYIYGGQYKDDIRLFSQGLGVPFFCDYAKNARNRLVPHNLSKSGIQAAQIGWLSIGDLAHVRRVPPPKFLKRYLERFDPDLCEFYKKMRCDYAAQKCPPSVVRRAYGEYLANTAKEQKRNKKL